MSYHVFRLATALAVIPGVLSASTINPFLWSDQTNDALYLSRDIDGNGDVNGVGETTIFFGEGNLAGLVDPAANIFTLGQAKTGEVYVGDGGTDTVYRLRDRDGNGQGKGESRVWFSAENASGLSLNTPNGVDVGPDGAVYVVEADTIGNPSGDFVYRTEDLNGDGDANDAGEATVWLDLQGLNPKSSGFEIKFDGDVAYIVDLVGSDPDIVYRAEDTNGDGVVSADEVTSFIDNDNPFGVPVDFAFEASGGSFFFWEFLNFSGPSALRKVTDLDGSGAIDAANEVAEVWNDGLLDAAFRKFVGFGIAVDDESGDVVLTSNGGPAETDFLIYLSDLNGDGDYFDVGETVVPLSQAAAGLPARARNAEFYNAPTPVPLPAGLPLLSIGLICMAGLKARRRTAR